MIEEDNTPPDNEDLLQNEIFMIEEDKTPPDFAEVTLLIIFKI